MMDEIQLRQNATRLWNHMKEYNGTNIWIGPNTLRNECVKFQTDVETMIAMGYVNQGEPPYGSWQWYRINGYPVHKGVN